MTQNRERGLWLTRNSLETRQSFLYNCNFKSTPRTNSVPNLLFSLTKGFLLYPQWWLHLSVDRCENMCRVQSQTVQSLREVWPSCPISFNLFCCCCCCCCCCFNLVNDKSVPPLLLHCQTWHFSKLCWQIFLRKGFLCNAVRVIDHNQHFLWKTETFTHSDNILNANGKGWNCWKVDKSATR